MSSGAFRSLLISTPILVALLIMVLWNPKGDHWGSVEPPKAQCETYDVGRLRSAVALTSAIYDQRKLDRVIREPQNTVSNLGYFSVGFAIVFAARRRLSKSLGLACMFLAVGSGIYHASLLPEWRMLDILGVYAALLSLAAVGAFSVVQHLSRVPDLAAASVVWALAVASGIHRNDIRIGGFKPLDSKTVVFVAVTVGTLFVLLASRRVLHWRRYVFALATLTVSAPIAFFGGLADRFGGVLAAPEALVQGHSLWHGLGAVALLSAYEAYASTGFDRSVFETTSRCPNQVTRDRPTKVASIE